MWNFGGSSYHNCDLGHCEVAAMRLASNTSWRVRHESAFAAIARRRLRFYSAFVVEPALKQRIDSATAVRAERGSRR